MAMSFTAKICIYQCHSTAHQALATSTLLDYIHTGTLLLLLIIIIIIIRNLYSAIMPLGGYRGAGGTGR